MDKKIMLLVDEKHLLPWANSLVMRGKREAEVEIARIKKELAEELEIYKKAFELICKKHTETVAKYYDRPEMSLSYVMQEWYRHAKYAIGEK